MAVGRKVLSLRKPAEFQQVISEGKRFGGRFVLLFVRPSGTDVLRVGVSASSRAGTSVVRNRLKRLLREAVRRKAPDLRPGYDLVLIAKAAAAGRGLADVAPDVEAVLRRAGLCGGAWEEEP
ncbi:MAG TPA: ribonuclease P protein component [Clostridiales bacterium]|mgnify:CR=1 FL=1|nr:ribonuclease P protein component [Clostridiales bacterium]HCW51843.1 ribonuclease P protein component [Clostridiales bacterium]